jgi:hypothetical protein
MIIHSFRQSPQPPHNSSSSPSLHRTFVFSSRSMSSVYRESDVVFAFKHIHFSMKTRHRLAFLSLQQTHPPSVSPSPSESHEMSAASNIPHGVVSSSLFDAFCRRSSEYDDEKGQTPLYSRAGRRSRKARTREFCAFAQIVESP